jgi:uncharacterized protein YndB with AHSA1/START domain
MLAPTKNADFVITRVFDAPRDLVWQAFTDPEQMKEWWGPAGSTTYRRKWISASAALTLAPCATAPAA